MPEILRLLYKNYGGIEWFEDKSLIFLCKCIENSVENEIKIPKMIKQCLNFLLGDRTTSFLGIDNKSLKNMRTADEIKKDYGIKE